VVRVIVQLLKILTISVTAVLVATGGLQVFDYAVDRTRPDDAGQRVEVTISEDDNVDAVADKLADEGLIRSKFLYANAVRFSGRALEPGEYTLTKGMTAVEIAERTTGVQEVAQAAEDGGGGNGAVDAQTETFEATIVEGWRLEEIAEYYAAESGEEGAYDAFMNALGQVERNRYEFLADVPADASLEGYLFPNTYDFVVDDPLYNIYQMLDGFDAAFTPEMRERAREMKLTIPQVVTLASLVEREAVVPNERPIIAEIYIKRWEQANDGWKLEADPTVQYAIGKRGNDWWPTPSGDDLFVDSPYNTYQNPGLPPGPICNPSAASLQAVLFPEPNNYMFFVAKGDGSGEHFFAATKEEQDANTEIYKQNLAANE
jgi:UPF0755 protein